MSVDQLMYNVMATVYKIHIHWSMYNFILIVIDMYIHWTMYNNLLITIKIYIDCKIDIKLYSDQLMYILIKMIKNYALFNRYTS